MSQISMPFFQFKQRLGLQYFPDTLHYRDHDLHAWLPVVQSLHVSWLLLQSSKDRAIPESFIRGCQESKIEPIVHFHEMPESSHELVDLEPLVQAYANWGVKQIIFYDQPNMRSAWSVSSWTQKNLVDQFLERFLPIAALSAKVGIRPVFPPLFPGGDYWDTIFLKTALTKIYEKSETLIDHLQLAAYSWTWGHELNWGFGGPQTWTEARPYTDSTGPDQRGFRNYEWANQISESILGLQLPVHLLGAGLVNCPSAEKELTSHGTEEIETILSMARLAANEKVFGMKNSQEEIQPLSSNVSSINFWLLSAGAGSQFEEQGWYQSPDRPTTIATRFQEWAKKSFEKDEKIWRDKKRMMNLQSGQIRPTAETNNIPEEKTAAKPVVTGSISPQSPGQHASKASSSNHRKLIDHYLLLPTYEWGISDWHLDVIRPYVKKHRATVGFSIKEAVLAKKVTVVGNLQSFPDELLEKMRTFGCQVERIQGDGTSIASQLATR